MDIIPTKPGDDNFHYFEGLPGLLYSDQILKYKAKETLNEDYLASCFIAKQNGKSLGRFALYDNPNLFHDHKKVFCIGNYECIDDLDTSGALLAAGATEAKKAGAQVLIGPMNGSTWDQYRFAQSYTHPLFFLEPYHQLYYTDQFISAGFELVADYISSKESLLTEREDAIRREHYFLQNGITFRSINVKEYESELRKLFPFLLEAFSQNFLYTPITWESFYKKYQEALPLIDPEFVLLAEDKNQRVVGLNFCYTDRLNTAEKTLVMKTLAARPGREYAGLGLVLVALITKKARQRGYGSIIHAFMLNKGTSSNLSRKYSSEVVRHYHLYEKNLSI